MCHRCAKPTSKTMFQTIQTALFVPVTIAPSSATRQAMTTPLSKRWARGVLKPWTSNPAQHQTLSKRWAQGVLKPWTSTPAQHQTLSKRWKRLTMVSPKKPLVNCRRICGKQPLVEVRQREQILDQIELIKTALDNGDYY